MFGESLKGETGSAWKVGKKVAAACCLFAVASTASALPFPNPDPVTSFADLDDNGYFTPGNAGSLSFELFDLADTVASFGFFGQGTPGTLIPIFEASDLTNEAAIIDFTAGYIFDVEDDAVQSFFTPVSSVGFYLDFAGSILYSDPTLNVGGVDLMGAFPSIGNLYLGRQYMSLLFFDGPADDPRRSLLSWHVVSDVSAVPVPASWLLMMVGLGLLAARRAK
jgi:hypothetical protein